MTNQTGQTSPLNRAQMAPPQSSKVGKADDSVRPVKSANGQKTVDLEDDSLWQLTTLTSMNMVIIKEVMWTRLRRAMILE